MTFNPLANRPKANRMTVAVKGAAGTGKSNFAASAQHLNQRLFLIDLEGKSRLLPGAPNPEPPFDAVEVRNHQELPQILDWLLKGDGLNQNYGTIAFDSF